MGKRVAVASGASAGDWSGRATGLAGSALPLTILESWLRARAGQPAYGVSFVVHWVQQILFYEAPMWVFTIVYTAFALAVVWAWRRYPPRAGQAVRDSPA